VGYTISGGYRQPSKRKGPGSFVRAGNSALGRGKKGSHLRNENGRKCVGCFEKKKAVTTNKVGGKNGD